MSASLNFKLANGEWVPSDFNVGNANCRAILAALGLSTDFENDPPIAIEDFKSALRLYLTSEIAEVVDGGVEPTEDSKPGCATMIHCGRREGYITDNVERLVIELFKVQHLEVSHVYFG